MHAAFLPTATKTFPAIRFPIVALIWRHTVNDTEHTESQIVPTLPVTAA